MEVVVKQALMTTVKAKPSQAKYMLKLFVEFVSKVWESYDNFLLSIHYDRVKFRFRLQCVYKVRQGKNKDAE